MDEQPKRRPAFFKVLNDDFATHLRLPRVFMANFGELLPEYPILVIQSGDSWHVKIEEVAKHNCFTQGWPEFVKDLHLERHDFLVFWFEQPSTLFVEVYGKNGPAKILNPLVKGKAAPKIEDDVSDSGPASDDCARERKRLCFSVEMRSSNKYRVPIPVRFLRDTGMLGSICLVLKDPGERKWPVLLSCHDKSFKDRTDMAKGWSDFRAGNGLGYGDTCTFTHTENPGGWLLQVQVKKRKWDTS